MGDEAEHDEAIEAFERGWNAAGTTDLDSRLVSLFAEVLTEHAPNENPLHCECGWFNSTLAQSDEWAGWKDPIGFAQHRAHQAEMLVARLEVEQHGWTLEPDWTDTSERVPLFSIGALSREEPAP